MSTTSVPETPLLAGPLSRRKSLTLSESKQQSVHDAVRGMKWISRLGAVTNANQSFWLNWGIPQEWFPAADDAFAGRLWSGEAISPGELSEWLEYPPLGSPGSCLRHLSAAYTLPQLAAQWKTSAWWDLVQRLFQVDVPSAIAPHEDPLPSLWLGGELPFLLSLILSEAKGISRELRQCGLTHLEFIAEEYLDGAGLPVSCQWHVMFPWLAMWTRCHHLGEVFEVPKGSSASKQQFEWMIRKALHLTRGNGSAMMASEQRWDPTMLDLALEIGNDPEDLQIARKLGLVRTPHTPVAPDDATPSESVDEIPSCEDFSEWSQGAIMRANWKPKGLHLGIAFYNSHCEIDAGFRNHILTAGSMETQITIDGVPRAITDDWQDTCWFSSEDGYYLEIESEIGDGWRLQRQFLLTKKDRQLFFSDALLGNQSAELSLQVSIPLGDDVQWQSHPETEDGWLIIDHVAEAWVAPLFAPEWRQTGRPTAVSQQDNRLIWKHQTTGSALYLPLLIDAHGGRLAEQRRTWRTLTVAQELRIVSADEAVGFRVQVGNKQWLYYRSLDKIQNRTVLGQNLVSEFYAGRFLRRGETDTYVEVE